MPAPSRAQRRRSNTRTSSVGTPKIYPAVGEAVAPSEPIVAEPIVTAPTVSALPAAASSRTASRLKARKAPEPFDYVREYRDVSKDLRQIMLWAGLLFVAMIALYFARQANLF